jgi:hypothetical protein
VFDVVRQVNTMGICNSLPSHSPAVLLGV